MRFWRRRSPGRHALGAAVTGIPSAVPRPAGTVGAASLPVPSPGDELRGMIHRSRTATAPARPAAVPHPAPAPVPAVAVPRQPAGPAFVPSVQLGFRDGTYASLDPSSAHSRALLTLAEAITSRD